MKVLIVTNLYPPYFVGGYELRCAQVAEYLQGGGYEVRVLTSSYGLGAIDECTQRGIEKVGGVPVDRSLHDYRSGGRPEGHFYTLGMARRQLKDVRRFVQVLHEFRPDVVNWWNLEGLTKTILPIPAAKGIPDVHCVADTWMIREYGRYGENESLFWFHFWRGNWGPRMFRRLLRRILSIWERKVRDEGIPTQPFSNCPRHVWFVSEFMRYEHTKAGLLFPSSEVIYSGVPTERFYAQRATSWFGNGPLRLLYAGYIDFNRALHTIVEALGLLSLDVRERIELSIAHSGPPKPTPYVEAIKSRIEQLGLTKTVTFLGKMQHDDMPRVYADHHVLIFSSTRKEGLPMTMMEAMCAGCAVVTTGSGGAVEIADLADLPIFPKDHPLALSRLIAKLVREPQLVSQIAKRGQDVVLREFTFTRMVESFSNTLQMVCNGTSPSES